MRENTVNIILAILMEKYFYGYETMITIIDRGKRLISIKDATIYTAFKPMEEDKWFESYWGNEQSDERRKYHRITQKLGQYIF